MKQLITFKPIFTPGAAGVGTLDFSQVPNFSASRLYAVINITRNIPIYVAGAAGLGATWNSFQNVLTLSVTTATHASGDQLNVYYDTLPGVESNQSAEIGGQLQLSQESLDQILAELKVMNFILQNGLNISSDDIVQLRNDVTNLQNYPSNY